MAQYRRLFIDFDSFYASVEQQDNPEYIDKPVIVVPCISDYTCAIASSYEAKRLGFKTGTKVKVAKEKIPGLFICGAFQLLGNYYETENGQKIDGLGICNFYTKNEGKDLRSVGKIKLELASSLDETSFKTKESKFLYGFENHGGHTYFEEKLDPLGKVLYGFGNDRKSKTEGLVFRGIIGTYLHGPVFSLNPEFCDYFIKKTSGVTDLKKLDDSLILQAREFLK